MSFPHNMDPTRIPDELWEFEGFSADRTRRHWVYWIDREAGTYFRKTENVAEDAILGHAQALRNERDGSRWSSGMGSDKGGNMPLVHVGKIPLNVFYDQFAGRLKQGDEDFAKWFLNRDENQVYRTRRGKL